MSAEVIPFAAFQVIKAAKELEKIAQESDPARIEGALARIREKRVDSDVEWLRPSDSEVPFTDGWDNWNITDEEWDAFS